MKTLFLENPELRAQEEFAEWWPKMLKEHADTINRRSRGHIQLTMLTDLMRDIYTTALIRGSNMTMEELREFKRQEDLERGL